jgi:peptidoglycan/xylan/chitin deacetylase (PgdA/CDA1 family)
MLGGNKHTQLAGLIATLFVATNSMNALGSGLKSSENTCPDVNKQVYLTFDTGHMEVAPLVAQALNKHAVKVTFFVANEKTKTGGASLDDVWAPWWQARAAEGHEFASHTWDHGIWKGDLAGGAFKLRPTSGPQTGEMLTYTPEQYCAELQKPLKRFKQIVPAAKPLALFRAPGGKTSPNLLAAAKSCGFAHVGWTPAGFLGDELASATHPNKALLDKALRDVKGGDIMLAHLGIWSRKDPWAPAVLEPLIVGLQAKGLCFAPISAHPQFKNSPEAKL